jgi:hypothetical protein
MTVLFSEIRIHPTRVYLSGWPVLALLAWPVFGGGPAGGFNPRLTWRHHRPVASRVRG